jgi:ABC-type multidrug transport system permease subunit
MTAGAALLFILATATAVQAWIRFGFGRRDPVGDENEYLARAKSPDPFGPYPFLRVPGMAAFVRIVAGRSGEAGVRTALAAISVATIMLTAGAGLARHGVEGALLCALLLIVVPDRIVLSEHIWPDTLLALLQAALLLLMVWSAEREVAPWLFGLVAALAVLTRIDAVALLIGLSVFPALKLSPLALLALWLPAILSLAVLTARNVARYRLWLPDTTALFCLSVRAEEHRRSDEAPVPLRTLIAATWPGWIGGKNVRPAGVFLRAARSLAKHPWRAVRVAARTIWQMLGADTFAIQVLLGADPLAYPDLRPSIRQALVTALRVSFPVLAAATVASVAANPSGRAYLLPTLTMFLAACLVARTRYRYGLLPGLTFAVIDGLLEPPGGRPVWPAALAFIATAAVALGAPPRLETGAR